MSVHITDLGQPDWSARPRPSAWSRSRARFFADSSATHGALSSHRVALGRGAAGAVRTGTRSHPSCSSSSTAPSTTSPATTSSPSGRATCSSSPGAGPRVRRAPGIRRRGADYHHPRRRAVRLLPPCRAVARGPGAAGKSCWPAGPFRHPLHRQRRLGQRPRRAIATASAALTERDSCDSPIYVRPRPPPLDTHDMVVIHRAFRRESLLLVSLIAGVDDGDRAAREQLAGHLRWYRLGLHNHHPVRMS